MATFIKRTGNMLKYVKTILTRVSFDALLFEKELRKAIKLLVVEEIAELKIWCYEKFSTQYEPVLARCFN
jgi:hypothetical protein